MKLMNIPYNNYKTQSCKYFDKDKSCKFGANCSFAHGGHELRNPYDNLPPVLPATGQAPYMMGGGPSSAEMFPGSMQMMDGLSNPLAPPPMAQPPADVKLLINNQQDFDTKRRVIEASSYIQMGMRDKGYDILNQLLMGGLVSFEYPKSL
jgi:hypothetical protein